jgi:predicted lipoprotein with Yx(FWY)xxD motif
MRHPKIIIAGIGVALAAAGGATAAVATSSAASSTPPAATAPAAVPGTTTVRITHTVVGGRTEAILTDAKGLPLYFYGPDTATRSLVSGSLAVLWPPLTSAAPAAGLGGKLTVVNDIHGGQVAYNGHPLYTFIGDRPGQVNGQGTQGFFVVTPGIAPVATSPASTGTVPAVPAGGGGGYGY